MLTKSFLFGPAGKTFENVQNLLMSKVIANLVIYNRLKYTKFRAPEFIPGFSGVRVTRSFVLCVCFVDRCPFAFFLLAIVLSVLLLWILTDSDYQKDQDI
jgi:hypothetical protein